MPSIDWSTYLLQETRRIKSIFPELGHLLRGGFCGDFVYAGDRLAYGKELVENEDTLFFCGCLSRQCYNAP